MSATIELTECPRDAMQGIQEFIPTALKIDYLNQLLEVGFNTLDFGSFVSPKAIPQLKDTQEVLGELVSSNTKLLSIVANERGAEKAASFDLISVLGFPLSISEEFQLRNTNSSRAEALTRVKNINDIATGKHLRVYLSMAFGNPYGEKWDPEIVLRWADELQNLGVKEIVLSDTVGVANSKIIREVYQSLNREISAVNITCHFHSNPHEWEEKISTAVANGCTGFDSAIHGYGGCPMANDDLVGNIATENLVNYFPSEALPSINKGAFVKSLNLAAKIFSQYH